MRPRRPYLAAAVVGAALLASSAGAAPHTFTIVVDKMKFGPAPANLATGDTVMFVNKDFLRHSATASDHSFDLDLPPNAKAKAVMASLEVMIFLSMVAGSECCVLLTQV